MIPDPSFFSSRLEHATRLAGIWHEGQRRRSSGVPYLQHLMGVSIILARLGFPEDVLVAAILHDAVEDTPVTIEEIREEFGESVAEIVAGMSERKLDEKANKRPWIERKTEHLDVLRRASVPIRAVALADKLHNLWSIYEDLRQGRAVWESFHAERSRVLWYYQSVVNDCGYGDERLVRLADECRFVLDEIESDIRPGA